MHPFLEKVYKKQVRVKQVGETSLHGIEVVLGIIVIVAVLVMTWNQMTVFLQADWTNIDTFIELLKTVLQLAIGVELARLLFSYSLETIIELAVFVVARKLLLLEDAFVSLLLGVISLVILFAAKHYFPEKVSTQQSSSNVVH